MGIIPEVLNDFSHRWDRPPKAGADDISSGAQRLGFSLRLGAEAFTSVYVNANGNVTFEGPYSEFLPRALASVGRAIIAPFWADVYTRYELAAHGYAKPPLGSIMFGRGLLNERKAFAVTWDRVDNYEGGDEGRDTFQLVLIASAKAKGAVDVEFNYESIQWDVGWGERDAARAGIGYSPFHAIELPGSGERGAFLDSNPNGLSHRRSPDGVQGRVLWGLLDGQPELRS